MFYPVQFLKKGGKFYLCWVADSWPLRFAMITHRQLWSQDIRKICDDFLEIVMNESGRPTNRFSLRLSSQILRGLVRLYQRKVDVFLGNLCFLNATVRKNIRKKFTLHEEVFPEPSLPQNLVINIEPVENVERVEEMLQNSGNVVANIETITLKEQPLPEHQPLNDNFGELHPDQPLQLLADRTLEAMMAQDSSVAQHSLELPTLDFSTEKSHDRSRLPHLTAQMEAISEQDMSVFRKSQGDELMQIGDVAKDIPEIHEFPEILHPEKPDPQKEMLGQPTPKEPTKQLDDMEVAVQTEKIVLEELEDEPVAKRRKMRSKIIDKNIKLSSNYLRSRIKDVAVELRCKAALDDIVNIRVPPAILLARPAHAGAGIHSRLGYAITSLFRRNLGVMHHMTPAESEIDQIRAPSVRRSHNLLASIEEVVDTSLVHDVQQVPEKVRETSGEVLQQVGEVLQQVGEDLIPGDMIPRQMDHTIAAPDVTLPAVPSILVQDYDMADLPTQVIPTLSQEARRDIECVVPSKKQRRSYIDTQENKENISDNIPQETRRTETRLSSMLQQAGLADLPLQAMETDQLPTSKDVTRRNGSDSSETPLGSLDRTRVSLGDSDRTTDSARFIRDQWGTESTMILILHNIKEGIKPLNIDRLLNKGPLIAGHKRIIAARCFTSILKLKTHGFVKLKKDPSTLEIKDIILGPRFDSVV